MQRLLAPLLIGLVGTAVLVALGIWQLQRLAWKEAVLADIESHIAAAPTAVPAAPDPVQDRYLPVRTEGRATGEELLVQSSLKGAGPGFRVVQVLQTEGRRVLLDRGFIAAGDRDAPRPGGPLSVTGNLHWPDEINGFTPDPDPEAGLWFARDIPGMAAALDTEPVLVVARRTVPPDPAITPLPVTSAGIPNDHLQYAVTWFLLAAVWLAMTGLLVRQTLGRPV